MVLVDTSDGLEVAGTACSSALPVLGLQRPSVLSETGSGIAASRTGALLLVVRHASAASAESVSLGVALTK